MNLEVDKSSDIAGEIEIFCKAEGKKITLYWVKLKLHLLNVPSDPWKTFFTVAWKTMATNSFTNCLNCSRHWFSCKLLHKLDTKYGQEVQFFALSVQQATMRT